MMFLEVMQIYSPTLGGNEDKREDVYVHYLKSHRAKILLVPLLGELVIMPSQIFAVNTWIGSCNIDSIPRSAAAAEGRDPRSTAAEASDRPKAATRSTPEASSPAQPPFGHADEVHSTLELELRTFNELEV